MARNMGDAARCRRLWVFATKPEDPTKGEKNLPVEEKPSSIEKKKISIARGLVIDQQGSAI